jgi:hypothetical protein
MYTLQLSLDFLISFVMGGPEQGEQVHLCTCSSTPLSMCLETSLVGSCAENRLCTYDLYSLCIVLDECTHAPKTVCTGLYKS